MLVTVAMPAYNSDRFIRHAIQGVLDQTFQDFELLIIDDASSDGTIAAIREFSDPRIRLVVNHKNIGGYTNFNQCLSLATGKYVFIHHCDDVMLPLCLEKTVDCCERDESLACCGVNAIRIDEKGQQHGPYFTYTNKDITFDTESFLDSYFSQYSMAVSSVLLRKSFIDTNKLRFDRKDGNSADMVFWVRLALCAEKLRFLHTPYFLRRIHPGQWSAAFLSSYKDVEEHVLRTHLAIFASLALSNLAPDKKAIYLDHVLRDVDRMIFPLSTSRREKLQQRFTRKAFPHLTQAGFHFTGAGRHVSCAPSSEGVRGESFPPARDRGQRPRNNRQETPKENNTQTSLQENTYIHLTQPFAERALSSDHALKPGTPDTGEAPATIWFPPDVAKSFAAVLKARRRHKHGKLTYLSRKFRKRFPAYAAWYLELEACALRDRGRQEEALALFREAERTMRFPEANLGANLVSLLLDLKRPQEAQEALRPWLERCPGNARLVHQGCRLLRDLGRYEDALRVVETADPEHRSAFLRYTAGDCLVPLGRFRESLAAYAEATALEPDFDAAGGSRIFMAHYCPDCDGEELGAMIRQWCETRYSGMAPTEPERLQRPPDPDKKLRIGLFSPGFNMHPAGWLSSHSLWFLSRLPDCELYFYSLKEGPNKIDPVTQRCRDAASKWINVADWNPSEVYTHALNARLDIAVDLAGHGEGCVLSLFARRIAPIQVKWVGGLFNTTGLPQMDYLLSDRFETPDGCDAAYTEHLVRLPHSYISYNVANLGDTERLPDGVDPEAPDDQARPAPEAPQPSRIRFASFNNIYKVNEKIADVWAEILKAVPESTLLLKGHLLEHEEIRKRILGLFTNRGIEPERVELEGPVLYADLMQTYRRVDIALDTWPYTGGLTTLEALWMGVPVITTPGPSFAGRHALSHLCNIGLESLVARDFDDYIRIAVTLAQDRKLLEDLRILLPISMLTSPIVQHHQLAADLHTAFRAMWERHCAGLPPVAMRFDQPSEIPELFKPFIRDLKSDLK